VEGMSEEQVSAPRRRTAIEAAELVAEFEASGLRRREFCQRRGLKISTLDGYRKRQRQAQAEAAGEPRWVEVAVRNAPPADPAASGLAVALAGGRRIEVARAFDAATLEQLLTVLERG